MSAPDAVIFDLDGVLVDSETTWDEARRALVAERGGTWVDGASEAMMGMSSIEWSTYMRDVLMVDMTPAEISADIVARIAQRYDEALPLLPHARETVHALAAEWPLGLASSSNRPIIERFLDASGLRSCFRAAVSPEEVDRGKPAPDVYLEAARRLGVDPTRCVAVEDSTNGIRAAVAAGIPTIAIPNEHFPPERDALKLAAEVLSGLEPLTVELVRNVAAG